MRARVFLVLSFLLLLTGSVYIIFLYGVFPGLVAGYGGGEGFALNEANDFTFQLPWWAHTRLHLSLQANDTIELYIDGDYICNCSYYELVVERGDEALVLLTSDSPVKGRFTARQEIPLEHQLLAFVMILTGLAGLALSITRMRQAK